MVRKLSRRFATNRELIRILLFIFKATTSQKVWWPASSSQPAGVAGGRIGLSTKKGIQPSDWIPF